MVGTDVECLEHIVKAIKKHCKSLCIDLYIDYIMQNSIGESVGKHYLYLLCLSYQYVKTNVLANFMYKDI